MTGGEEKVVMADGARDAADERAPSERVVERVAAAENVDPAELEPPLFDVVDPDALDVLFNTMETGAGLDMGAVRFAYHGYDVSVSADGTVSVSERD